MTRRLWLIPLLLTLAPPLHAQGTKDSVLVRANRADLDSIARDKTAPSYSKRAQARIRLRDSLFLVRAVPTPTPTPTPAPTPDTTVVVKPDTVTPVPVPVPPPPSPVTAPIFVHPYPPLPNGAAYAELPRDTVSIAVPTPTRTIAVVSLQAAYDTAKTGDLLLIPRNHTTTHFYVRPTARASWVTIQGTDSTSVIRQTLGGAVSAVNIESRAHHVQFKGPLTIKPDATATSVNAVVRSYNGETTAADAPHHIILDGVTVDVGQNEARRCVWPDGAYMAVVNSRLLGCATRSGDAQGIFIANGPGPYRFEGNYIQGGHQCFMSGGADPSTPNAIPSDIVFRYNVCEKPLNWHYAGTIPNQTYPGTARQVKTIAETKNIRRALFEYNVFRNVWVDAQAAFCVLFKSSIQEGFATWTQSLDITFRYNRCVNVASGANFAAHPNGGVPMTRVSVYDNRFDSLSTVGGEGICYQILDDIRDLVLLHNTCGNATTSAIAFGGAPSLRTAIIGNVIPSGMYGVKGDNAGVGNSTLSVYLTPGGGLFQSNALVGGDCSLYPSGTVCPASITSPMPLAPDGKPIGADPSKLTFSVP